jgi:hypothetical protein
MIGNAKFCLVCDQLRPGYRADIEQSLYGKRTVSVWGIGRGDYPRASTK